MDDQHTDNLTELRSKIFSSAPHGYLILNPELVIVDVNAEYLSMTRSSETDLVGRALFDAFPDDPNDAAADGTHNLRRSLEAVIKTKKPHRMAVQKYDIPVRGSTPHAFEEKYWQPLNSPVIEQGDLVAIVHHVQDVTAEFLGNRDQAIRLRLSAQVSGLGYGELDLRTRTANVSRELAELFGFPDVEGTTPAADLFDRIHPDDRPKLKKAMNETITTGDSHVMDVDYRVVLPDAQTRWINTRGELLWEFGEAARFVGVSVDLTNSKMREEALQQALADRDRLLKQKETLLGDVNHRVKNSLQLVSSILRIEASTTKDTDVRASLEQASGRVHAVSSVHELIYKSDNVTHVDIGDYVPQLVSFLSASVQSDASHVNTIAEAEAIVVPTDTAINLALLINELVTNAYKHAFPDGEPGRIDVVVAQEGDILKLTVADDGVGLSAEKSISGLGSKIIAGIVGQLGGEMKTEERARGYGVRIEVPIHP